MYELFLARYTLVALRSSIVWRMAVDSSSLAASSIGAGAAPAAAPGASTESISPSGRALRVPLCGRAAPSARRARAAARLPCCCRCTGAAEADADAERADGRDTSDLKKPPMPPLAFASGGGGGGGR